MTNLSLDKRQLCDIQGRLFILSLRYNYDSLNFIKNFMNSRVAIALDDSYDRLQWAGEEYILEELEDEIKDLQKSSVTYTREVLYWIGYVYRYWHYYTGESSRQIYETANAEDMNDSWLGFHTYDVEMAIDDLKDIYTKKQERD